MVPHTENTVSDEIRGLGVVTHPASNSVSDEIRGLGVVTYREYSH